MKVMGNGGVWGRGGECILVGKRTASNETTKDTELKVEEQFGKKVDGNLKSRSCWRESLHT